VRQRKSSRLFRRCLPFRFHYGEPEICHDRSRPFRPNSVDHYVRRLQVAMHKPMFMQGIQSGGDLAN